MAQKSGLLLALNIQEQFLLKGKRVLGTVWYIFRLQDGCELPENGGLLGLCLGSLLPEVPNFSLWWEDSDPASLQ